MHSIKMRPYVPYNPYNPYCYLNIIMKRTALCFIALMAYSVLGFAQTPDHTYNVPESESQTESNVLTGTGEIGLLKTGLGELVLSGNNTYTGETQINGGTVTITAAGTAANGKSGTFYTGTTVTVDGASTLLQANGGDVLGYWGGSVATLNLNNGATLKNTKTDAHLTMGAVVNMNQGKIEAAGNGSGDFGAFVFDKKINVTGGVDNAISGGQISFRAGTWEGFTCTGGLVDVADGAKLTISSLIKDNDSSKPGLTKTGAGELVLSAFNTFTGPININDGTVTLTASDYSGTFYTGTTVTVDGASTVLQANGGDVLGYWGGSVATLNLNNGATLKNTKTDAHLTMGAVVNMNQGKIEAAGNGSGDFGAFVFDKKINVTGGVDNAISGGQISFRAGTWEGFTCTGGLVDVADGAKLTISSLIKDNDSSKPGLTKTGAGELVLSAFNTFTGPININDGTVTLTASDYSGTFATGTTVTVDGAATVLQGHADILGYGNKSVATLNLNNGGKLLNDSTNAHITVDTVVNMNNGLIYADPTSPGNLGNFVFDDTINALTGTDNNITANKIMFRHYESHTTGGTINVAQDAVLTINANIQLGNGVSEVVKTGEGTLILAGANTYNKSLAVNGGLLHLAAGASLNNITALNVAAGAAVSFAGNATSINNLQLAGTDSILLSENGGEISSDFTTVTGSVSLLAGSVFALTSENVIAGALLADNPITLLSSNNEITDWQNSALDTTNLLTDEAGQALVWALSVRENGGLYSLMATGTAEEKPVPEPTAWALLLLGALGLLSMRRKK